MIASFSAALIASGRPAEAQPAPPLNSSSTTEEDQAELRGPDRNQPPVGPDEIASLLPLLVPLPEQKRLAQELRALLASGDVKVANEKLNAAIEVGTLASILLDWISSPALVTALQSLPAAPDPGAGMPGAGASVQNRNAEAAALTVALELGAGADGRPDGGTAVAESGRHRGQGLARKNRRDRSRRRQRSEGIAQPTGGARGSRGAGACDSSPRSSHS